MTRRRHSPLAGLLALLVLLHAAAPAGSAELVMIEQAGCHWCARWNEEIGGIYGRTEEGRRAPLRRISLDKPIPREIASLRIERFTPTFILIDGNREIGRIRGYPGADFFWGLLGQMLEKLPSNADPQS